MSVTKEELEEMNEELTAVVSRLNEENRDLLSKASKRLNKNLKRESRRIEKAVDGLEEVETTVELTTTWMLVLTGATNLLAAIVGASTVLWLQEAGQSPVTALIVAAVLLVGIWVAAPILWNRMAESDQRKRV
jgi:predicted nuclease with TOPRIM domain